MDTPAPASRPDVAGLAWSSAIVLAGGVWLLAPSVAWFDSGELAAAAVQLGVPHPTGFALFDLAGHSLSRLPLAPAALRVHLLGLLSAVFAVALVWRTWPEPRVPHGLRVLRPVAWLLPLTMPALAMHQRAAEVYAPTWLVAAAALWALQSHTGARRVIWLALCAGLGAGVHVEAALLPGLAAVWAWWQTPRADKLPAAAMAALVLATSLLAIAYLPLAAGRKPLFSWGDVRSWPALLDHLSARSIRLAHADRIGRDGWAALAHLVWRDSCWLLPLALVGAVSLERHKQLLPLVALAIADALYSALINPMGLRDDQAGLLVLLAIGLLAAHGWMVVIAWRPRLLLLPALAGAVWLLVALLVARPDADLRAGARLADRLLRDVPPGSLLLASADHTDSACLWLQTAEGARPDSPCLPLALLRDPRMLRLAAETRDVPGLAAAATVVAADRPVAERVQAILAGAGARPVGWEPGLAAEDSAVLQRLRPAWPWHWLAPAFVPEDARHADVARWLPAVHAVCPDRAACADAPTLRRALATPTALLAATRMLPAADQARDLLEAAVALADDDAKVLNNLAALEVQSGHPQRALDLCERALEVEPDYARAHRTAARAALFLQKNDVALAHAAAYVAVRPPRETRPWLDELAGQVTPAVAARLQALRR